MIVKMSTVFSTRNKCRCFLFRQLALVKLNVYPSKKKGEDKSLIIDQAKRGLNYQLER